mmetsp:Transcript_6115/g.8292  ORF Transcript_6115/g.8292 Transcript_6115/m.8292 type:complete len:414 (+) Transcript_6115:370-1611(+)
MCLFSKNWVLRDAALQKIENQMGNDEFRNNPREVFRAICKIVSKFLKDKVANVFHSCLQLLKSSVTKYSAELSHKDILATLSELIPVLVEKSGESNMRMAAAAAETLAWLASSEAVGLGALTGPLLRPLNNAAQWRPLLARLQLLTHLLPTFGIAHARPAPTDTPAFPLDSLMAFVNQAFTSSNGEVRNAAVKLTLEIYKKVGKAVEKFLPKSLKPAIKDILNAGFEQVAKGEDPNAEMESPMGGVIPPPAKNAPIPSAITATPPATIPAAEETLDQEEEEGPADVCQFCALQDARLAQGENMDLHFYHDCPMLGSCTDCGQIIEIASVNEHLLHECEQMALYAECPRCMEAIKQADLEDHRQANSCVVAKPPNMYNRCPLCHMDIPPHQEGWREHLLKGRGCPANTRSLVRE